VVENMQKDKRFGKNKKLRYKTASFVSVPIQMRDKVIGVLNLTDREDMENFKKEDLLTFTTISTQIGKNYENLIYYNEFLEKQKIEKELEVTRDIQQHILPKKFPKIENISISAVNIPAKEVGGDFYDYIKINESVHCFLVADVSGKSLPAGMFMALSRNITRVEAYNLVSPAKVLEESNKYVYNDSQSGMFVTMFYMALYTPQHKILFGSAGHNEQLFYNSKEDNFYYLKVKGIPLGIAPDSKYMEGEIEYHPNDILVLYTDGVTEAMNKIGEEFGLKRLEDIIKKSSSLTADEILENVLKEIKDFTAGIPQFDDITLLIIKFI
jgi:serine phosphatase RsbU (regulator of sigma subunit)